MLLMNLLSSARVPINPMATTKRQYRLRILSSLIATVAVLFIARLYFVQIQNNDYWEGEAKKQYIHTSPYSFDRGKIYFTGKDGELFEAANIASGWLLTVNPTQIKDIEGTYKKIASVYSGATSTEAHDLFVEKAKKVAKEVEVFHRIPDDQGQVIADLHLPGVYVRRETWRAYPMGNLASQVVGFVGHSKATDGSAVFSGLYGIEKQYDDLLSRDDSRVKVSAFAQLFGGLTGEVQAVQPNEHGDIVLTIEPQVEKELEKTLGKVMDVWKSKQVGGIVMDARTGAILGMGALPNFDPNDYASTKDISAFRNSLVQDRYEMGSIIKPLTVATGFDTGAITLNSTYNDTGCMTVNKKTFCNFDQKARGPGTTMQDILTNSLNVGVSWITGRIGHDAFREYFTERMNLGGSTGIDLPNEQSGQVGNLNSRRDIEYYTASFGQGIAMSAVTTAAALASLGNGGTLVHPHVGKAVLLRDHSSREFTVPPATRVFSEKASEDVTRLLVSVVENKLLNGAGVDPYHRIAAKTGTAQIAGGNGKYDPDKWLHTFFAYAPAYDPKFIIFLFNKEPQHVDYASQTLGKPAMDLMHFLLGYYNVPPDREPRPEDFARLEKNKRSYAEYLKNLGLPQ
jgi:stage V sporulation protein D (sporulation-specific penicillin-binding protein)